jgi:anti-sigma B factor antagonist
VHETEAHKLRYQIESPLENRMIERLRINSENTERHGRRIVRVSGRVSLETVPEFLKALRAEQASVVILDLSGVPYMDSAGVGALVQIFVAYQKNGQMLALAGVTPRVDGVLEIARVKKVLKSFPDVATAEQSLG